MHILRMNALECPEMPAWELAKRLWVNWRTGADRVPAEPMAIVQRVLARMERDRLITRGRRGWRLAPAQEHLMQWNLRGQQRFEYPRNGICRVSIFTGGGDGGRVMVVLTELPENEGTSVTNAAEYLCLQVAARWSLNPTNVIFIEHYPPASDPGVPRQEHTFDRITLALRRSNFNGGNFSNAGPPAWKRLQEEDWKRLSLTPQKLTELLGYPPASADAPAKPASSPRR